MKITAKFDFTWCWSIEWNRNNLWLLIKPRDYKNQRINNICDREIKYYTKLRDAHPVYEN